MKIYLASSWRNTEQPQAVTDLRESGHLVYDFRNPPSGSGGFGWKQIDPNWEKWTAEEYRRGLQHRIAQDGFYSDFDAMRWADVGVLLLPAGRSAHLELGWMAGRREKRTIIWTRDGEEPELMALMADHICISLIEVLKVLNAMDGLHAQIDYVKK